VPKERSQQAQAMSMLLSRKKRNRQMFGFVGKVHLQFSGLPENSGPDLNFSFLFMYTKFQLSCTQRRRIETSGVAFEFAKFGLCQFRCSSSWVRVYVSC